MPSRNISKPDVAESFYHVYARGASKQIIFVESLDYNYFVSLFARYLSKKPVKSKTGEMYPHYYEKIELQVYCLMNNHFHLLIYQKEQGAMKLLMKSIMSSYCQYFNLKYGRSGSLWESTYKAALVDSDAYLHHISRYIHLNPRYWIRYPYSSINLYLKDAVVEWLVVDKILSLFSSKHEYEKFLRDLADYKSTLDELEGQIIIQ